MDGDGIVLLFRGSVKALPLFYLLLISELMTLYMKLDSHIQLKTGEKSEKVLTLCYTTEFSRIFYLIYGLLCCIK